MNVADAVSYRHPQAGQYIRFEDLDRAPFPHYGIGIHVLWPGGKTDDYPIPADTRSITIDFEKGAVSEK